MSRRWLRASLCLFAFALAVWAGRAGSGAKGPAGAWLEVRPGVWRTPGLPAGYALVEGDAALLLDAPLGGEGLRAAGVKRIDGVLLTHHHRDTCAAAATFLAAG